MTSTPFISNPLVAFRMPEWMKRQTGLTHHDTRREDVENDAEGLCNIYPGEFKYKPDPTLEIELAIWEDTEHSKSLSMYHKMIGKDGYNVAMASDFDVCSRLSHAWKADDAKRLTLGGKSKNSLVLMWRTGENYDKAQVRRLRISNEVQKSAEERQAEMQDKMNPLGGTVRISVVDDDGSDETTKQVKKRR